MVYVAATLGPERSRMESYELDKLDRRPRRLGGREASRQLAADEIPPAVQFSLTERDDGAVIVTVTNHATNPVRTGGPSITAHRRGGRHSADDPSDNGRLDSLDRAHEPDQVQSPGRRAGGRSNPLRERHGLSSRQDGWVSIELPRLGPGDCVVLSKA